MEVKAAGWHVLSSDFRPEIEQRVQALTPAQLRDIWYLWKCVAPGPLLSGEAEEQVRARVLQAWEGLVEAKDVYRIKCAKGCVVLSLDSDRDGETEPYLDVELCDHAGILYTKEDHVACVRLYFAELIADLGVEMVQDSVVLAYAFHQLINGKSFVEMQQLLAALQKKGGKDPLTQLLSLHLSNLRR